MNNRKGFNKLSLKASHRKALHNNMITSLFRYERVKTTKAKAMSVKKAAEKIVTRAKEDSVHNRRVIAKRIHDKAVLAKLFTEIGPRYKERPGGYTRVLKLGRRDNDAAEMVLLELVVSEDEKKAKKKPEKKKKKEAVESAADEGKAVTEESVTEDNTDALSDENEGGDEQDSVEEVEEKEEEKEEEKDKKE